jgi:hypothetical protein
MIKRQASPRLQRKTKMNAMSLAETLTLIPALLPLLPNDQDDVEVQGANLPSLWNFDFRDKQKKTNAMGTEIQPTKLSAYNKKFSDLYRLGNFIYRVTDGIAGQTHFGDLLFVQMNPTRLFEGRVDTSANVTQPRSKTQAIDTATTNKEANERASQYLAVGGLDYMRACFEYATKLADKATPVLLVLGEQLEGRDVNCEPYECREFVTYCEKEDNVHLCTTNQTAEKNKISRDVDIYHLNMTAFENAQIDSRDIEKLFAIYRLSMLSAKPLMIHCTDGMDRAGGVALAFQLLHNWGRIFTSTNLSEIAENIINEHEQMQQLRGPSFCTASNGRVQGAVLLATIMKAIQRSAEICSRNQELQHQLKAKQYLQQIYSLQDRQSKNKALSDDELELLLILRERLNLEALYFDGFASGIQHPQTDLVKIEDNLREQMTSACENQRRSLLERFSIIKNAYRGDSIHQDTLNGLQELKLDVETLLVFQKISIEIAEFNGADSQNHINSTLQKIDNDAIASKEIKLKRKKALLIECQAMRHFAVIDKLIRASLGLLADDSSGILNEFTRLQKNFTKFSKEALILDPNIKKMNVILTRLEEIPAELRAAIEKARMEKEARDKKPSKLGASLNFLSLSPRSSIRGLKKIERPTLDESTFEQGKSPPATSAESNSGVNAETEQPPKSFSLSNFFKDLSPRSRRHSKMSEQSVQDEDSPDLDKSQTLPSVGSNSANNPDLRSTKLSEFFKTAASPGGDITDANADLFLSLANEPGLSPRQTRRFQESPRNSKHSLSPRASKSFSQKETQASLRKSRDDQSLIEECFALDADIGADLADLKFN